MPKDTEASPEIKRSRRRARLLLAVISLLLALAAAEAAMRLLGWADTMRFTPDDRWGYLMTPEQEVWSYGLPVRINRHGLRGPDIEDSPNPHRVRIVFVGDSVTYGGGRIREEDLFCRVFEQRARNAGIDAEAVNLSAPGWSPQNWRAYIESRGCFSADMVVMVVPECDFARPFSTMTMHGFQTDAPPLRLWALVDKAKALLADRDPYGTVDRGTETRKNLAAIRATVTQAADRPAVLVLVPSRHSEAGEQLWGEFAATGTALDARAIIDTQRHYQDAIHLNAEGHRAMGEFLFQSLQNNLHISQAHGERHAK